MYNLLLTVKHFIIQRFILTEVQNYIIEERLVFEKKKTILLYFSILKALFKVQIKVLVIFILCLLTLFLLSAHNSLDCSCGICQMNSFVDKLLTLNVN